MSRVIHTETAGKERAQLSKAIVLATRELMKQQEVNNKTRDLAAFITLALEAITDTIDNSVLAWEKRGYWVKTERFRMEWAWAEINSRVLRRALIDDDWAKVASTSVIIAGKLQNVKVPTRHRMGEPWNGAWEVLEKTQNQKSE